MEKLSVDETGLRLLLDALGILTRTGCEHQDAQQLWCSDWASSKADSTASVETKAQAAKLALSRLKLVAKQLTMISNSLKATIELVERESWPFIQSAGFASLPDELLARIFEMCMPARPEGPTNYYSFAMTLACVCRRFRHIALHTPRLWEYVGNLDKTGYILNSKGRCRNPCVFVHYWEPFREKLEEFVHRIHPANQWKSFILQSEEGEASRVFGVLTSTTRGNFGILEALSIQLNWEDEEGEIEEDIGIPHTNLSDSDAALLSTWKLPMLQEFSVSNFIPRLIDFPNLRHCDINLSRYTKTFSWDIDALKQFLHSVHLIESLSFAFRYASSPAGYNSASSTPVKLPRLTSFAIHVEGQTKAKFLADVMDVIDMPVLSELKVFMDDMEEIFPDAPTYYEWLHAVFTSSGKTPRVFPKVTSLDLHVPLDTDDEDFRQDLVLLAVPHVQHLRLKIPTLRIKDTWDLFEHCELRGWDDLRSVHIDYIPSHEQLWFMWEALRDMFVAKRLEKLEEIELSELSRVSYCRDRIEELFGDKLVKKDLKYYGSSSKYN